MSILFARHGESEANLERIISNRHLPHKLTPVGVAQASALAERMAEWPVKILVSSPVLRARETAMIIGGRLGLPFAVSSTLREFDCGTMEGRGDAEAWAAHHAVTQAWDEDHDGDRRLPEGESFNEMKARFLPYVAYLSAKHEELSGDILLISHGGLLHHMLPLVIENVDRAFTQQHPLENCALVTTEPQESSLWCLEWAGVKVG